MILKQGNLFPDVEETVTDENGNAIDITGAIVTFSLRKARSPGEKVITNAAATVVDGPTGAIKYGWLSGDNAIPAGTYQGLFKIAPQVGDPFYAPTDGWVEVVIEESF